MSKSNGDSPQHLPEALLDVVGTLVREVRQGGHLSPALDSSLEKDLGLDSLARVELLARVEQHFGVSLAAELIDTAQTPRDLLQALQHAAPASQAGPVDLTHASSRLPGAVDDGQPVQAATLVEVLEWHVSRHAGREHVIFYRSDSETETLTYGELHTAAARIATGLAALGVEPGQCVAMMLPSGLDFFRCFFGILYAGAVPVPIYPPARPSQVEAHLRRQAGILSNCEAPVLITFERVHSLAQALTGLSPALRTLTTPAALLAAKPGIPVRPAADDLALIQYTSGSTGAPKGVALSHRNLLSNIVAWGQAAELSSSDVCVSWLPLYHDMGLIGTWMGSLYHALPLVLMSPLDFLAHPERWLWAIHRHRGTVAAAPNFAYDLCVKRLADRDLDGLDLSSWRLAANGAEPVSPDTLDRFAQTFAKYGLRREILMPVYGLAECSVGLAVPPPGRGMRVDIVMRDAFTREQVARAPGEGDEVLRFVSCGPPLPGHEVRVVGDKGENLPERHVGLLEFRGPSATRGYHRNPEANESLFDRGWLNSGDYAYVAEGEIYITGRAKDLIIRGGRNFYPYDLELAVGELDGVRKGCVAVFGVADAAHGGERLVVVAETTVQDAPERGRIEGQVMSVAADTLGLPPDDIVLVPPHAVLKTSSGKIRRSAVRDAYVAGRLGAATAPPWRQALRLYLSSLAGRFGKGLSLLGSRIYGVWIWAWFMLLLMPAVVGMLALPGIDNRWRVCHRLARAFARLAGCRLELQGLERLPSGGCVLVSNHASYIDGFVIAAVLPHPVRFVAKAEFMRNRFLHLLFRRMGAQFVERFESSKGLKDVETLVAVARDGPPLLFFAEGTFSAQSGLRPFRLGAFRIAASGGLPVVPLSLAGTRKVLRDGTWWPRRGPIRVTIGEPIRPVGDTWHDMVTLRDQTRRIIGQDCGESQLDHF